LILTAKNDSVNIMPVLEHGLFASGAAINDFNLNIEKVTT
jgi:hypothetical protein